MLSRSFGISIKEKETLKRVQGDMERDDHDSFFWSFK